MAPYVVDQSSKNSHLSSVKELRFQRCLSSISAESEPAINFARVKCSCGQKGSALSPTAIFLVWADRRTPSSLNAPSMACSVSQTLAQECRRNRLPGELVCTQVRRMSTIYSQPFSVLRTRKNLATSGSLYAFGVCRVREVEATLSRQST